MTRSGAVFCRAAAILGLAAGAWTVGERWGPATWMGGAEPPPRTGPRAVKDARDWEAELPGDLPELGKRLLLVPAGRRGEAVLAIFETGLSGFALKEAVDRRFRRAGWTSELAEEGGQGGTPAGLLRYTKGRRRCLVGIEAPAGEVMVLLGP